MNRIFNVFAGIVLVYVSITIIINHQYFACVIHSKNLRIVTISLAGVSIAALGFYIIYFSKKVRLIPYIYISLSTLLLFAISLETWSLLRPTKDNSIPLYQQILIEENFPYFDEWLIDRAISPPDKKDQYRDYYLFTNAPPGIDTPLFKTRKYYSARFTPDSSTAKDAKMIIWTFGGSTMQNMETIDRLTIANQIAVRLNEVEITNIVYNFGTGSFQSTLETIKFMDLLKRVNRNELPDYVIFYDGFNDSGFTYMFGAINLQWGLSLKMKALVNCDNKTLLFYSLSNILATKSVFWNQNVKLRIDSYLFGPTTDAVTNNNVDNLLKGIDAYEINTIIIRGACKELGIKPIFILQPMIFTKRNLTPFERKAFASLSMPQVNFMKKFYEEMRQRMFKYKDFYDLTTIIDNSKRNDFYDYGHTGPYTGITIGRKIGDIIISTKTQTTTRYH